MFRKYTPLKYLATYDGAKLPGAIKSWKLATFSAWSVGNLFLAQVVSPPA